jgi:hypothetical protein
VVAVALVPAALGLFRAVLVPALMALGLGCLGLGCLGLNTARSPRIASSGG